MAFLSLKEMKKLEQQSSRLIILSETVETGPFDIFLSHSYKDKVPIRGVAKWLMELKYTVYVDWINDKELNRSRVNADTARRLQERMRNCRSLLFATTENSSNSKWMPWELGFMDGITAGRVAILPVTDAPTFDGQEYLGMYPYVDQCEAEQTSKEELWVNQGRKYVSLKKWLQGKDPYDHSREKHC